MCTMCVCICKCSLFNACLHCVVFVCMCKKMTTHVTFREECGVNDKIEQDMNWYSSPTAFQWVDIKVFVYHVYCGKAVAIAVIKNTLAVSWGVVCCFGYLPQTLTQNVCTSYLTRIMVCQCIQFLLYMCIVHWFTSAMGLYWEWCSYSPIQPLQH